jgi:DNA-binding MarR family transcriptional regulator
LTIELLIHSIVRQTTVLIAQLATSQGVRAPLAQIANQVFVDLAREVERQGVSRSVSANMFGLGLRTYRRKIQRLSESSTERGRSLWEIVLEYIVENKLVHRQQILGRFSGEDDAQVKAVLRDLCDSQLVFSSGTGLSIAYRAATAEESAVLQKARGTDGEEDLILALMYREGPLTQEEIATVIQTEAPQIEVGIQRLVEAGRIERIQDGDDVRYRARALVIPFGSPAGWEGAVFDHFRAMVSTVLCRLRENRPASHQDHVGGSTYAVDVWDGHPLAHEVLGTLGRVREMLGDLRNRVDEHNAMHPRPDEHSHVVVYVGQCVFAEGEGHEQD